MQAFSMFNIESISFLKLLYYTLPAMSGIHYHLGRMGKQTLYYLVRGAWSFNYNYRLICVRVCVVRKHYTTWKREGQRVLGKDSCPVVAKVRGERRWAPPYKKLAPTKDLQKKGYMTTFILLWAIPIPMCHPNELKYTCRECLYPIFAFFDTCLENSAINC